MPLQIDIEQIERDARRQRLPQLTLHTKWCHDHGTYHSAWRDGQDCPVCETSRSHVLPVPEREDDRADRQAGTRMMVWLALMGACLVGLALSL